ncbi:MAG: SRPBCC family protein [Gemmatimonadota bacterium]|nr:MAG: SRPBCC family protein [Gemmatimonadota bacterium]
MTVRNVHTRELPASKTNLTRLIDCLASDEECLWPNDKWPAMRFDRPLSVGAVGGHGPIGYTVEQYEPGNTIQFRFTRPTGLHGFHRFDLEEIDSNTTVLRHTIETRLSVGAMLRWYVAIRPLHDALMEDALDRAEAFACGSPQQRRWSPWVRFLRRAMRRKRKRSRGAT